MRAFLHSIVLGMLACVGSAYAQGPIGSKLGAVREWESNSFALDRGSNTMTFDGFRIVGENWSLSADAATARATELEFEVGEWWFQGHVKVVLDTASLEAGSAVFTFRQKRLVRAELRGSPVTFEDAVVTADSPVQGTSETLRYDDDRGTFELLGSVTLTVGPYRTTGCDLVYYLGQEEFTTGSTQCQERFRTIIVPQESADPTTD